MISNPLTKGETMTDDRLNFHSNGDVFRINDLGQETYIGRIDTEGDWQPEDDECPWSELELKSAIAEQVAELGRSYTWPIEQLQFAGLI